MTSQGRRLSGYEALALQGIMIDDVDFTMESEADLGDLAGNAMSYVLPLCVCFVVY
jgi:hypothetical protein